MPDDRKPIKISSRLWNELKRRQSADREATGVEPTQGELMDRAWEVFSATPHCPPVTPANQDLIDSLNALARKLSATQAELNGLIVRSTKRDDADHEALRARASQEAGTANATADRIERDQRSYRPPKARRR